MKEVKINRFLKRKPEKISFTGAPVSEQINTTPQAPALSTNVPPNVRSLEQTSEPSNQQNQYVVSIPLVRKKTRHSFDIYEDQKSALDKIQMALTDTGSKQSLGELAQEALDLFIKQKSKSLSNLKILKESSEQTNENPNVR